MKESPTQDNQLSTPTLFSSRLRLFKRACAVLIVVLCVIGLYQWSLATFNLKQTNFQDIAVNFIQQLDWISDSNTPLLNSLMLFIFISVATAIGLPRQIAALIAGINLGVVLGVVVATLATTVGCLLTFLISRHFLSATIKAKYPTQLDKLSSFLGEQTFLKALVIRIMPLGSNFITNIVAGVTTAPTRAYVSGSCIGFIPQMVIFSLAGSGVHLGDNNQLVISGTLFIIAFAISLYLLRVHRKKSLQV